MENKITYYVIMLILVISFWALLVWAWKRGWRWWAIVPFPAIYLIIFLLAITVNPRHVSLPGNSISIIAIAPLALADLTYVFMIIKPRKKMKNDNITQNAVLEVENTGINKREIIHAQSQVADYSPEQVPITGPRQYNLSMSVNGEGNTVPDKGVYEFKEGTVVYINATPSDGWKFAGWMGQVEDHYSAGTSIEMNSDKTITALFQELK
jgi:hypothetical protein